MVLGYVAYHGQGTLTLVEGSINIQKYIDILVNYLWPIALKKIAERLNLPQVDTTPCNQAP